MIQDVEACTMSNPRSKENTDWEDIRHLMAEEGQMSPKTMLPPTYRPPKKAKGLENIEPPEPKRKGAQGFGLPGMTVRQRHLSRDVSTLRMLPLCQRVSGLRFSVIYMTLNQSFMILYIFQHADGPEGTSTTCQWKDG
jgi:hypothetical protein